MRYKRILITPLVIVIAIVGVLQIPLLRTPLLHYLVDYGLRGQGMSVTFSHLSGLFPFYTSWRSITLNDAQGPCLEVNNLEISWSPWQWFQGENTLNFVNAQSLQWQRLPNELHSPQGEGKKDFTLVIPSLTIQEVILPHQQRLQNVTLSIAITPELARLNGKVTFFGIAFEGEATFAQALKGGVVQGTAYRVTTDPVHFNLPYQWDAHRLHIRKAAIKGKGLRISGEAVFSHAEQQGQLHFQIDQLKPWADYFHIDGEGDGLTGTIILTNQKEINGHIEANHFAWKEGVIVASQADYCYSLAAERLESLKLTCQKAQWQDFLLTELSAQLHQKGEAFYVKLLASDAFTEGKLHLSGWGDARHINLEEAFYQKARTRISLTKPLVWDFTELWPRSEIDIKVGQGSLHIAPVNQAGKAHLTLQKFPLECGQLFTENWPLQGTLSGTGWVSPVSSDLPYQLAVKSENFQFSHDTHRLKTHLTVALTGSKDDLQWRLETARNPLLYFKSEGGVEWATYALNVQSKGTIALDIFNRFLGKNDRMAGQMKIQLAVSGFVNKPLMNGQWRIQEGRYEDGDIGLVLKDIAVQGHINNSLLTLSQVTAKDAAYGKVTGKGKISFQNGWTPLFDLKLELDKITLAQTDEIKGLANGPIFLKGVGSEAKLFATLDVLSLIYDFGDRKTLPRTLQFVNQPDKPEKSAVSRSSTASRSAWIPMKLVLNLTKPLVIRGEGLKSYWQGPIVLEGDLKNAYLTGHLQLEKGDFEFFGKKLKLTEGTIDFDKEAPNDPQIMLRAVRETMSIIIYLQIAGRTSNPAFSFFSTPPLPMEEIVARLLFDKSLGEMSSMQGMQVASALASLQTRSGLNVFNKLRNVFGLDVLEFKQVAPDPRQVQGQAQGAISLGKQVSEQVYVRAEQGLGADSSKVGVEVKVTPHLSIEADVGGAQSTGAGLNWSKRY